MKTCVMAMIGALLLSNLALAGSAPATPESGQLTLPDFRSLENQATESTVVTLGPWLLHFASHFASNRDPDSAATKRLLATIKSLTIHSYEFDRDNVYSQTDVEAVRSQLTAPNWTRLAQVRSKLRDNVDVYVSMEGEQTTGLAIISSEPRELTIVNIVGPINPEDWQQLSEHLNLPGVKSTESNPPRPVPTAY